MVRTGLIRGIILVSFLAVLVTPLFTVFLVYPALIDNIVENAKTHARQVATHLTEESHLKETLTTHSDLPENLEKKSRQALSQFQIHKIRLFHATGKILFSTDPNEIGNINRQDYFRNVVAKGGEYTKVVEKNSLTLDGEPVLKDLVEVYVPIMQGETFVGAFEIYSDITATKKELNRLTSRFYLIIFPVALILLVALVITSQQASKKITARVRAEEKAKEHVESRFYELFNSMNSSVTVYEAKDDGRDFLCIDFNQPSKGVGNLGEKAVLGRSVTQIYPDFKETKLLEAMLRVWQSGEAEFLAPVPYTNKHFKGWWEHHIYRLSTHEVVVITDDVTRQEEAQERVRRAREELEHRVEERTLELRSTLEELRQYHDFNKTVIDSMPDAVSIIDTTNFQIVGANRVFYEDYRITEGEVLGTMCHQVTHGISSPCQPPDDPCPLTETLRTGQHAVVEHTHYRADGEKIYVEVSTSPVFDEAGEVYQVVHVSRDITPRKEAEKKLEKALEAAEAANQAKSEFLAKISHELRTPLNGIIGFAELINFSSSSREARDYSGMILGESEMLRALIEEILDHAKIEAGRVELESLPFDLLELLNRIESSTTMQARKKGLGFTWSHTPEVPSRVVGDPNRLRQILVNLLDNAIKFTTTGSVSLSCTLKEDLQDRVTLHFAVTDTGIGIPEDKKESILESFVQADDSMSRKYGGIGLGTTIVKHLVKLMGGEMGFDSREGHGSTFWFTVILDKRYAADSKAVEKPLEDQEKKQCQGRILVVEDYPANQEVARRHLQTVGYSVELAANGLEAVEKTDAKAYDLILMDVQMPEMDGYEATRTIRSQGGPSAATPILAMTANAGEMDQQLCIEAGMDAVLIKPLRRKSFLETVDQWISKTPQAETAPESESLPEPTSVPLDYDRALEEFLDDKDFLEKIISGFIANVEEQLEKMRQALADSDTETLRKEAHSIKGGAANLAAMSLSEAAREVETLGKEKDKKNLPDALEKMVFEFDRLRRYLDGNTTD